MIIEQRFASKELILTGKKKEEKKFILRPYEIGDEYGMIECIRSEYADTYFKRDFYQPEILRQKATGNYYRFFVASSGGRILAMLIFTLFMEEEQNYLEPASEIISVEARGYGLAEEFVEYVFPYAKQMKPNCLFVHAVTFHNITQKLCEKQGMIPCGFRLGTFLVDKNKNSYEKKRCLKQSEGILILPVEKKSVGNVFYPKEIAGFVEEIYQKLDISYTISTKQNDKPKGTEECQLEIVEDTVQRSCLVKIKRHGHSLQEKLKALIKSHPEPYWTYQLTIDADSDWVFDEYEQARTASFFFSGMKPLCGRKEQFYVQWTGELKLYMEDYCLTDQFALVREQITDYYEHRIHK